jgi:hypothetical protein
MKRSSRSAIRFFRTTNQGTMAHEFDGKKYEQASAHQKEWGAKLTAISDDAGRDIAASAGGEDGMKCRDGSCARPFMLSEAYPL